MNHDTVPSRFARSLLALAEEHSGDVEQLLALSRLPFDPRLTDADNYSETISAKDYSRLYGQVLRILQDETFGLNRGGGVNPGAFRMMCYSILGCENLGKAMRRASDFYRTFFDRAEGAHVELSSHGDWAAAGYRLPVSDQGLAEGGLAEDAPKSAPAPVTAADVYGLSAWHRFFGWLIGTPIELNEVHFSGAAPASLKQQEKYEALFACPVRYQQQRDQFLFDPSFLSQPLVHTEQSLKAFLRSAPHTLMNFGQDQESSGLLRKVRHLIGHDFSQGVPGFERIAESLGMSAPTLRRRLREEGSSFQRIKDSCRREAAETYLLSSELSINTIASLMGFTDPSAFHRCFRKWTGMTPGAFRERGLRSEESL